MSDARHRLSVTTVNVGLASNILLAALKTAVGIFGHSPALLADGINSTSDAAYFVVVRVFMALARKPADREHPYGHTQLESIAALVVGAFVISTAVAILWDAVNSAYDLYVGAAEPRTAAIVALWIALGTVAAKLVLAAATRAAARRTDSLALFALASDHRNDVFSAAAAALGILFARAGHPWADPLAGALVSLVVLRTGIGILRSSSESLMDTVPSEALERQIADLLGPMPGVLGIVEAQAHRFGPYLVVNLTVLVDATLTIAEGDRFATRIERTLEDRIPYLRRTYVHLHPAEPAA
jgi:cation diffusion facilitator family transporter